VKGSVWPWSSTPKWLLTIEILGIVALIALSTVDIWNATQESDLIPLDAKALKAQQGNERWNGVFFEDQHVGFTVNRTSALEDGRMLLEQRSMLKLVTFDKLQTVITAGAALTDDTGHLQRFDFFMKSDLASLSVKGEIKGRQIIMEIDQGNGEIQELDFPIEKPPHVALSLESQIRQMELSVGTTFSIPYFDPVSMSDGEMLLNVVDSEVLDNGEEAWWVTSNFNGVQTRSLIGSNGDILRQEGALGISMVRMSPEAAQDLDLEDPVDLIGLSGVPVKGKLKNPRTKLGLVVRVLGVPIEKISSSLPFQRVDLEKQQLSIQIIDLNTILETPIVNETEATDHREALIGTLDIPSDHPDIRAKSAEILTSSSNRLEAIESINQFVFDYMEKTPVIGIPNGLSALRQAQGDCNEHTALFVSLARAAKIPARIAAGIVFSDRTGPLKQFYYHAWPEVLVYTENNEAIWLPVDPTFGQVPADATHIKLVEGGLDRQVEIMGYLGQIKLEVISDNPSSKPKPKPKPKPDAAPKPTEPTKEIDNVNDSN
jgi:hypothetical protein